MVIAQPRWTVVLALIGCASLIALGFVLVFWEGVPEARRSREATILVGILCVGFFGACLWQGRRHLSQPTVVTLSKSGFQVVNSKLDTMVAWTDLDHAFLHRTGPGTVMACYRLNADVRREPKSDFWTAVLPGVDGYIPEGLPKSPRQMVDLLNDWKRQYG